MLNTSELTALQFSDNYLVVHLLPVIASGDWTRDRLKVGSS